MAAASLWVPSPDKNSRLSSGDVSTQALCFTAMGSVRPLRPVRFLVFSAVSYTVLVSPLFSSAAIIDSLRYRVQRPWDDHGTERFDIVHNFLDHGRSGSCSFIDALRSKILLHWKTHH